MRAVVQRVTEAGVEIEGQTISQIAQGLVVLLGIRHEDSEADAEYLAAKIANLRIFQDDQDKMNLSLLDVRGEALVISQFTLYGNTRKGRRPSFIEAAPPAKADPLYEYFMEMLSKQGISVKRGVFGAMMLVRIHNYGPVTILLDSEEQHKPRQ
ncbi:MAG: D-tyrosyl-tRNA(Tyr) deacylase [Calditrichaeota bacterium]|nr:D-tyrosyl-tRNA(Tyr) deacylase [Calditrichota bacterium]RQW08145.1 MAG: D-tyrosyl-tRNA(Tyr) deacylase [Calditrichota bacterium]